MNWMDYTFKCDGFPQYVEATNVTREHLTQRVTEDNPPHVARFGDGEILCCLGWEQRSNCDGHPYSPELSQALALSIKTFTETQDVWLGNWFWWPLGTWIHGLTKEYGGQPTWCQHEIFMHGHGLPLEPVRDLYLAIRNSDRRKVLVGPEHVQPMAKFLRTDQETTVPTKDGWSHYESVLKQVLSVVRPGDLVLIAWGMPAKPLMADIIRECPEARCFDIGSGLDPLVGKHSRAKQPELTVIRQLYGSEFDA